MKTERSYYDYSIDVESPFRAQVLQVRPGKEALTARVVLDRTIFYPEGGGQPCDFGTLAGFPVVFAGEEENGEIFHVIRTPDAQTASKFGAEEGSEVDLIVDGKRRRDLSTAHTAQHLLSGALLSMTGFPTVSMHLGEETCTIDVEAAISSITMDVLSAAEDSVMEAILRDLPVITHLCPPEDIETFPLRKTPPKNTEVIRVVEIRNRDFSPCCGTHLTSTGKICMLRILGAERYKDISRITWLAGSRVLAHSRRIWQEAVSVSHLYSVPPDGISAGAEKAAAKLSSLEAKCKRLLETGSLLRAEKMASGAHGKFVSAMFTGIDAEEAAAAARQAQKLTPGGSGIAAVGSEDALCAVIAAAKGLDVREAARNALTKAGGTGGGGPAYFNASFPSKEALHAFLRELETGLS